MAKGKYQKWLEPESLILLEGWTRDGLTDEEIAKKSFQQYVVTGLCGANCYHSYWPFFKDIDEPIYTEEQLAEMNKKENTPVEYNGKKYTKYEALQRQRRLETTMRAQRQQIKLLKEGGASEDDITIASGKYQATSSEYTRFSKAMNIPQQRERVTIDGLGDIGQGKYTKSTKTDSKSVANSGGSGIINLDNDIDEKQARFLYDKMSRNQRIEVIQKGQSVEKPIFSYDREDNKAMAYLQKVPKQENTFDIMTHGSPNSVEFFKQDYPQGDIRSKIDAYTLSLIMRNREDYTSFIAECKEKSVTPIVRLLSCNTGNTTNTGNCFAQLLANELGVKVEAPNKTLYVLFDGSFHIGDCGDGTMKLFYPRK